MIPLVSFRGKGTCWHSKINIEKRAVKIFLVRIKMSGEEKLCYLVSWYDSNAALDRKFQLYFYTKVSTVSETLSTKLNLSKMYFIKLNKIN